MKPSTTFARPSDPGTAVAGVLRSAALVAAILAGRGEMVFAQRGLTEIPPPDPEAERAAMTVADGFEVTLFAADPLIRKPLQINFDPRGRLWVSSSSVYPQIRPGEVADDEVTILEDRDGDGRADSAVPFADGLLMPTAVLPGPFGTLTSAVESPDDWNGAFVANSTELLHLADTDGDGVADRRRVVLSGFGAEDTHHIIHTFRFGPDSRLYFNQSIYIHSHVETPSGVKRLNGGGIWRFHPASLALDVFARGWVNAWGHAFDPWGRSLVTDGAGGEGISYGFPGAAYQAAVGAPRILQGMNPGSPKYCGLERIDGRHMPDDSRGVLLTNDFRANRVCRFRLSESGSGFQSEKLSDLIQSTRVTFRPIDAKMGPDGALYIADWYNPIIQHGEVDFSDVRRDREHGRIWRVTAKGRPLLERIDFSTLSDAELFDHLASPEGYARDMARRVLVARAACGRSPGGTIQGRFDASRRAEGGMQSLIASRLGSLPDESHDVERLGLLWLRQGLDRGRDEDVDRELLEAVLESHDPRARAAACRVAGDWVGRLEDPLSLLEPLVVDDAMLVRLEAVRTVAAIGNHLPDQAVRSAAVALRAVDRDRDDSLDYAIWLTARELSPAWVPALVAGRFDAAEHPSRVIYAAEAADASEAVPWIAGRLAEGVIPAEDAWRARGCIARLGGPRELEAMLEVAVSPDATPGQAADLLGRMLEAHRVRRVVPSGDLSILSSAIASPDERLATLAVEAAGCWRVVSLEPPVGAIARANERSIAARSAAVKALGSMGSEAAFAALRSLAFSRPLPPGEVSVQVDAITALVPGEPAEAARAAVRLMEAGLDAHLQSAIFRSFLATKGAARTLAEAIHERPSLPVSVARSGLAEVSSSGRQEPELTTVLEQVVVAADPAVSQRHSMGPEALAGFMELVRTQSSALRGEAIYRREALRCVSCHRVGREGGKVGPDLTAIGASSQFDYLVDSLLHPAKNVKEGYATLVIQSLDGRVVAGIPLTRSSEEVVLRDATNKEVRIRIADIDEESAGTSLMPAGLVDTLSRQELADLVRYLSELGRAPTPPQPTR